MRPSADSTGTDVFGYMAVAEVDRYLSLLALARSAGVTTERAGEIAKLVIAEFVDVPVDLESAEAVVARVEELASEVTSVTEPAPDSTYQGRSGQDRGDVTQ